MGVSGIFKDVKPNRVCPRLFACTTSTIKWPRKGFGEPFGISRCGEWA